MELDRIAVRIVDEDLLATGSDLDVVPKRTTAAFVPGDQMPDGFDMI